MNQDMMPSVSTFTEREQNDANGELNANEPRPNSAPAPSNPILNFAYPDACNLASKTVGRLKAYGPAYVHVTAVARMVSEDRKGAREQRNESRKANNLVRAPYSRNAGPARVTRSPDAENEFARLLNAANIPQALQLVQEEDTDMGPEAAMAMEHQGSDGVGTNGWDTVLVGWGEIANSICDSLPVSSGINVNIHSPDTTAHVPICRLLPDVLTLADHLRALSIANGEPNFVGTVVGSDVGGGPHATNDVVDVRMRKGWCSSRVCIRSSLPGVCAIFLTPFTPSADAIIPPSCAGPVLEGRAAHSDARRRQGGAVPAILMALDNIVLHGLTTLHDSRFSFPFLSFSVSFNRQQ
ncbi:hypothetical protein BOTBODRAFT_439163 [Botryobasidium botryosum FD-172 SS1]|uniref:Uncharacterized protein n=1 Tax=Botryobasidium botryosum (strain FD-172 SS1) TaxID=930990 RepID=A0A067MXK6_BOTB1|nr:hypothetical protein BOTBODRAFT_439163 [Botryobasidium botryosum FD-172 SS1]